MQRVDYPDNQNGHASQPQQESKFRKLLFNEVSFVGMIIAMTISVSTYLAAPSKQNSNDIQEIKTNIALIQQSVQTIQLNHEAHIQTAMEEIADSKKKIEELQAQQSDQDKQIVRLLTIVENRLK